MSNQSKANLYAGRLFEATDCQGGTGKTFRISAWGGYLFREMQRRATAETVDFIYENMPRAIFFEDQFKSLQFSLKGCI
jgi:hypothetical protein